MQYLNSTHGVLWRGKTLFEGSVQTTEALRKSGKRLFYVTNNSSKTRAETLLKLKSFNFPATEDDIICTAHAAAWCAKLEKRRKIYLVGSDAMAHEMDKFNLNYFGLGPDPVPNDKSDWAEFTKVALEENVDCVMVGFDRHISYRKLICAASYLAKRDCLYIATNRDKQLPTDSANGVVIPGTGSIVAAVSTASTREPDRLIGKPGSFFMQLLQDLHQIDPTKCLMIGDNLETDIAFAKRNHLSSLLVLTGVASTEMVDTFAKTNQTDFVPDYYTDKVSDLAKFIH